MARVLIGFAEAVASPEVVFSLRTAGHKVSAFARRADLPLARLPLEDLHVLPAPEQDSVAAIKALLTLMAGPRAPDAVLPLDDPGLWLITDALGEDPRIVGAKGDQAAIALDKKRQIAAAKRAGLSVPPTDVIGEPGDLPSKLPLPAIVKPAMAIETQDGRLVKGTTVYLTSQTQDATAAVSRAIETGAALVQPLTPGVGEGVFGFSTPSGVFGWSGHRRLRMMNPHGSGSSACISNIPDAKTRAAVESFINDIGWRGPFMVEFLRSPDGTLWFMEMNGRMWGSLALARRQGLEYPAWAMAQHADLDFQPDVPPPPGEPLVLRNLGRDLLHLLFVLRGPESDFHRRDWPSFFTSLRGVLRPAPRRAFYNYDPEYPAFFLRDAASTIKRTLRR